MRVSADREICFSAGICVMAADSFFDQDVEGIVLLASAEVPVDAQRSVANAVKLCPSGALRMVTDQQDTSI